MPRYNPEVDYYEILQVHPHAHQEVIKHAYHTILRVLQAHPDLGGNHETAVRVNVAYAVLSDPAQRTAYDEARRRRQPAYAGHVPGTVFPTPPAAAPPPAAPTMLTCPRCGKRNRLPAGADLSQAICGKCHAALTGRPTERARAPVPARAHSPHPSIQQRLLLYSEVRLRLAQVPPGGHLHCRRCGDDWQLPADAALPHVCPHCARRHWSDFRLFQCRFCGHRFPSETLYSPWWASRPLWPWPYWIYPVCPACALRRWHRACEQHPLRALLNALRRLVGAHQTRPGSRTTPRSQSAK